MDLATKQFKIMGQVTEIMSVRWWRHTRWRTVYRNNVRTHEMAYNFTWQCKNEGSPNIVLQGSKSETNMVYRYLNWMLNSRASSWKQSSKMHKHHAMLPNTSTLERIRAVVQKKKGVQFLVMKDEGYRCHVTLRQFRAKRTSRASVSESIWKEHGLSCNLIQNQNVINSMLIGQVISVLTSF